MRIVGGRFRGTQLAAPGAAGGGAAHLRPTADRVREALFNVLEHGPYAEIEGARVLDLFAGTGALGLEAVSRGAAHAVFVDDLPAARALIRQNVETLRLTGQTKIWRRDATRLGPCPGTPYGLIFADPPYNKGLGERALVSAAEGGWLADDATVILEESAEVDIVLPPGFALADERRYGDTRLMIMTWAGGNPLGVSGAPA